MKNIYVKITVEDVTVDLTEEQIIALMRQEAIEDYKIIITDWTVNLI